MNDPKKRTSRAEVAQRVAAVLKLRLAGAQLWDLRSASQKSGWGVSDRQIYRYIEAADRLIEESTEHDRDKLLRHHLAVRRNLFARAINDGAIGTALAIARDECELLGLYAHKVELSGKDGGPLQVAGEVAVCGLLEMMTPELKDLKSWKPPTETCQPSESTPPALAGPASEAAETLPVEGAPEGDQPCSGPSTVSSTESGESV